MARGKSEKKPLNSQKEEPSIAAKALDNFPSEAGELRRQFVDYPDALVSTAKAAAQEVAKHNKELIQNFNAQPTVTKWLKDARKLTSQNRGAAVRQFIFLLNELGLNEQGDLFNDVGRAGGLTGKDDSPVFDKTGNNAAPRMSQTEPVKKLTGAEPPLHVPSPALPLDEAQQKLEEAKAAAEAKRGGKPLGAKDLSEQDETATKDTTAAVEKIKSETLKPPGAKAKPADEKKTETLKPPTAEKSATLKPPGARSASAVAKATVAKTNRKPTADEEKSIKKKADRYIAKDGGVPDTDENDPPGSYH